MHRSPACQAPACSDMDNDAFAAFYERSARSLWAYLARVSCDPALADDLMQESYVRFLCAAHPADGEVAARRYLFRIATNLLRDHWRRPRSASLEDVPEQLLAAAASTQADSQAMLGPAMAATASTRSPTALAGLRRGLLPSRNRPDHRPRIRQHPPAPLSRPPQSCRLVAPAGV